MTSNQFVCPVTSDLRYTVKAFKLAGTRQAAAMMSQKGGDLRKDRFAIKTVYDDKTNLKTFRSQRFDKRSEWSEPSAARAFQTRHRSRSGLCRLKYEPHNQEPQHEWS